MFQDLQEHLLQQNDLTGFGEHVGYRCDVEISVIVHYYLHRDNGITEFYSVVG